MGFIFAVASAQAAIITVNSMGDSGSINPCATKLDDCTLRGAITKANGSPGHDTIRFSIGVGTAGCDGDGNCTISLGSALPNVTGNLSIEGPGPGKLVIRRNANPGTPNLRIFTIVPGLTVAIAGVAMNNGLSSSAGAGAILNEGSQLTIRDCVLTGNVSNNGGAIWNSAGTSGNAAKLTLLNTVLSFNAAQVFQQFEQVQGGAILNASGTGAATTIATNCTFLGNFSPNGGAIANAVWGSGAASIVIRDCSFRQNSSSSGGAIQNLGDPATPNRMTADIRNSTFSDNHTNASAGGAIFSYATATALINCTLSGNSATTQGGGAHNTGGGRFVIQNCTFSGNISGNSNNNFAGGLNLANINATTEVVNTIFDRTINGDNLLNDVSGGGSFVSLGHNLSDDPAGGPLFSNGPGGLLNGPGDQRNADPGLGTLADNGGPTQTHAITTKSDAFNKGDDALAPKYDQRGFVRSGVSDVGAYENGGLAQPSLANISTRLRVETGDNALIAGFIVTGTQAKKVIVRGMGPSLSFPDRLANPTLELYNSTTGALLSTNDDWVNSPNKQAIIDSTIPPSNDLESAIVATLPAESTNYTAILRGASDGTGIGVVEVYDLDTSVNSKLANISTRGLVGTGDNVLIAGTIVVGQPAQRVIVRAIGPSLPIAGALANPTLQVLNGNGTLVGENDNWRTGGQEAEIIATTVPPTNDLESAVVGNLSANAENHTAIVRGAGGTTGIAVVEIYRLQ
jgi:hypothetical protein